MRSSPTATLPSPTSSIATSPIAVLLLAALLVLGSGVVAADGAAESDGIAHVIADDVVIGEDEQSFGPMRVGGVEEDDDVVVEIDLAALERHGVGVETADVDLVDADVDGASLESATVEDGIVRIAFDPSQRGFAVDEFRLTGIDTTDADAATAVEYDVSFSHGDGKLARSFDLIDPDETTPTLESRAFVLDDGSHSVRISRIQPVDDEVTLRLDVTELEAHDVGIDDLAVDAEADGARVRTTVVDGGVVTLELEPDDGAVLFDVRIGLENLDTDAIDTDEAVYAEGVTYEATIEGDADDTVERDPFDLVANTPTPYVDTPPETTTTEQSGDGGDGGDADGDDGDGGDADNDGADDDDTEAETVTGDVTEENVPLGLVPPSVAVALASWLAVRRD